MLVKNLFHRLAGLTVFACTALGALCSSGGQVYVFSDTQYTIAGVSWGWNTDVGCYVGTGKQDGNTIAAPDRPGYSFTGWYTTIGQAVPTLSDFTVQISTAKSISDFSSARAAGPYFGNAKVISPKYEKSTYKITLDGHEIDNNKYQIETSQQTKTFTPPDKGGHTLLSISVTGASGGSPSATTSGTLTIPAGTYGDLTLTSNWKANEYKVTFDGNGGTPSPGSKNVFYDSTYGNLATCTRAGYTFVGWYTSASGGNKVESTTKVAITSAQTLYAHWTPNTYKIAYNLDDGGVAGSTAPENANVDAVFCVSKPTRDGYRFTGWKVTNADYTVAKWGTGLQSVINSIKADTVINPTGEVYFKNLTYDAGATVMLVAQWEKETKSYKVTVEVDSTTGSVSLSPQVQSDVYAEGTKVTLSAKEKPGYAFKCWHDGETELTRNITVTNDLWFKANFTNRIFTLTFDGNGGTPSEVNRLVEYQAQIGTMPTATQSKKTLAGWWTDRSGGQQITAGGAYSAYSWTTDMTLYAHWKDAEFFSVSVVVEPENSGTVEGAADNYEKGDGATLVAKPNEGYSFREWQTKGGERLSTDPSYEFTVEGNSEYRAVFTGNVYKVTYDGQRWYQDTMERFVTFGGPYGDPPDFQFDGYKLDGWYTSQEEGEGELISPTNIVKVAKNHRLYAKWSRIPTYSLEYHGNGATGGGMTNETVGCGVAYQLASNQYERIGYVFAGWATNGVSEVVYTNGETVVDLAAQGEAISLYAVWKANEYTVIFEPGDDVIWSGTLTNDCTYGVEWQIPTCVPTNKNELLQFAGWQQEGVAEPYPAGAMVSNLTAEADGIVTLKAIWKFDEGDYSRALGCTNLVFDADSDKWKCMTNDFTCPVVKEFCVRHDGKASTSDSLSANIHGSGELAFKWYASSNGVAISVNGKQLDKWEKGDSTWKPVSIKVEGQTISVHGYTTRSADYFWLADVRWTPDGVLPTPDEAKKELTDAGFDEETASILTADMTRYERLDRLSKATGKPLSELAKTEGAIAAAALGLDTLLSEDAISISSFTPSEGGGENAMTVSVKLDATWGESVDEELLKAALGAEGSGSLTSGFSKDNIKLTDIAVDRTAQTVSATLAPSSPSSAFFYRVHVK